MIEQMIKRLLGGMLTLWVVATLTFGLIRLLPGGPFDQEHRVSPVVQQNLEKKYHLDKPWPVQYGYFMWDLIQGDLGPSYTYQSRSVNDIVKEAFLYSLQIGWMALLLGSILGMLLGTLAGITRSLLLDGFLSLIGVSSLSTPSFIFGGGLVLLFSLYWKVLPSATLSTPWHYVLPVLSLSLVPFAYTFLLVRTAVKETKSLTFVLVKRSFGLSETKLAVFHVLRNSLLSWVSVLGPIAAALVTGSFAVEYIFAVPGLGKHFVTAVSNRDYPLVMGITLVYSLLLILFNIMTDWVYGFLDPRLGEKSRMEKN